MQRIAKTTDEFIEHWGQKQNFLIAPECIRPQRGAVAPALGGIPGRGVVGGFALLGLGFVGDDGEEAGLVEDGISLRVCDVAFERGEARCVFGVGDGGQLGAVFAAVPGV